MCTASPVSAAPLHASPGALPLTTYWPIPHAPSSCWDLQDCSVIISPISDTTCAEPGSSTYNYELLKIYGYYAKDGSGYSIKTMLPTVNTGYST